MTEACQLSGPDFDAEWERCKSWLEAANIYGRGTHTIEDILDEVLAGDAQFWPGWQAAIVTQVHVFPRLKAVHFWLCGGDLEELVNDMRPAIEAWAGRLAAHVSPRPVGTAGDGYWPNTATSRFGMFVQKRLRMSKSKSKTTTQGSTTQTLDPWVQGVLTQNLGGLDAIKSQPFQYFTGPRIASFNPTQLDAQQRLLDFSKGNVGAGLLAQAVQAAQTAASYQPAAVSSTSYIAAPNVQPISQAATIDRASIRDVGGGSATQEQIGNYLNPYTQSVVDTSLADIENQRKIRQAQIESDARRGSAFGGTGAAVASALSNDSFDRNAAQTAAQLRSQGYNAALAAAQADVARAADATRANQAADLSVSTANAGFQSAADQANLQARLSDTQRTDEAARFNAGQDQTAQLANRQGELQAAQLSQQSSQLLASLSDQERSQILQSIQTANSVGDAQQALEQKLLDFGFEQHEAARLWPMLVQQLSNDTVGTLPMLTNTQTSGTTTQKESGIDLLQAAAKVAAIVAGGPVGAAAAAATSVSHPKSPKS